MGGLCIPVSIEMAASPPDYTYMSDDPSQFRGTVVVLNNTRIILIVQSQTEPNHEVGMVLQVGHPGRARIARR